MGAEDRTVYIIVERWLPKRYVYTRIPRTCEDDLMWEKGLYNCNQVKDLEMR